MKFARALVQFIEANETFSAIIIIGGWMAVMISSLYW